MLRLLHLASRPAAYGLMCLFLLAPGISLAQSQNVPDEEMAILEQVNQLQSKTTPAQASAWRHNLNYTYQHSQLAFGGLRQEPQQQQAQFTSRYDAEWDSDYSGHLAYTLSWREDTAGRQLDGRVQEAYLSFRQGAQAITEIGLSKLRFGIAYGYNPNDVLANYQHNSSRSFDPADQREARSGIFALRQQWFLPSVTLGLVYLPALYRPVTDFAMARYPAPNSQQQLLFSLSPRPLDTAGRWQAQILAQTKFAGEFNLGFNMSGLLSDASVWHLEWLGSQQSADCRQFNLNWQVSKLTCAATKQTRQRLATGINYSFANKLSILAEYYYDNRAPDQAFWTQFLANSVADTTAYYAYLNQQQQLTGKHAWLVHANWQDVVAHWDLSAYWQQNRGAEQTRQFLQLRYRQQHADYSLQFLRASQLALANQPALARQSHWQFSWRWYF